MTKDEIKALKDKYFAALDACNEASAIYEIARKMYHAREIGDVEFLEAQAAYKAVGAAFDAIADSIDFDVVDFDSVDEPEPEPVAEQLELF